MTPLPTQPESFFQIYFHDIISGRRKTYPEVTGANLTVLYIIIN